MRSSIVWEFNKLYWSRLRDWSLPRAKVMSRPCRAALPTATIPRQSQTASRIFGPFCRSWNLRISFPRKFSCLKSAWGPVFAAACG